MRHLRFIPCALLLLACGPDVEDICERIEEECVASSSECLEEGQRVEQKAEEGGCDDQLSAYLDCLDEDICTWQSRCDAERAALQDCSGPFPR